jgi:nickel/cobalt transporter (NicO) family protein
MEFQTYFLALSLGVLHAFEPGHGKTAIAMFSVTENIKAKHILSLVTGVFISHSLMLIALALLLNTVLKGIEEELVFGFIAFIGSGILFYIGYNLFPKKNEHPTNCSCGIHRTHMAVNRNKVHNFGRGNANILSIEIPVKPDIYLDKKTTKLAGLIGISGGLIPCPTAVASFVASSARGDLIGGIISVILFSIGIVLALLGIVIFSKFWGTRLIDKFEIKSKFRYRLQLGGSMLVILAGFYSLISVAFKYRATEFFYKVKPQIQ